MEFKKSGTYSTREKKGLSDNRRVKTALDNRRVKTALYVSRAILALAVSQSSATAQDEDATAWHPETHRDIAVHLQRS